MRVYDLAKEYGYTSKEFTQIMKDMGIPIKNHMSALTAQQEKYFRNNFNKEAYENNLKIPKKEVKEVKEEKKAVSKKPKAVKEGKKEVKVNRVNRPKKVNKEETDEKETFIKVITNRDNKGRDNRDNKRNSRTNRQNNTSFETDERSFSNNNRKFNNKNKKNKNKKEKVEPKFIDNSKKTKISKANYKKKNKQEKEQQKKEKQKEIEVVIPNNITVNDLAGKLEEPATNIIRVLMGYGIMATMNQTIDFDTASIVAEELSKKVVLEDEDKAVDNIFEEHFKDEDALVTRPPIITVMGHVDHGKTSLLDAIRHTNVISGEAGGITQHIGAYTIKLKNQPITFIDTPGHEAFTAMRSRGAEVTDIAILVVAADDGVMPQTVEAINHAKNAEVPIIVAINKIDKPGANPDKVKQELTEYGLVSEEWGGDTIFVNISAKKRQGIEDLLEMILLVAEVEDLKANPNMRAIGTVIEARLDKQRGATATLLVKSGTLKESDIVVCNEVFGRIRAMSDDNGKKLKTAGPSTAIEMLGFNEVPDAGEKFFVAENERQARKFTEDRKAKIREHALKKNAPVSLDDLFNQISEGELKELKIIVKADVQGSLEALTQSLEKLNENDLGLKVSVIHGGVGAISESDVILASASNALIVAFNVRPDQGAKAMAQKEEVEIRTYNVIYQVIEEIEQALKGLLDPEFKEVVTATVEVRQTFKVPNVGTVAGGYVIDGTVNRNDSIRVIRDGIIIFESEISSLKRFKDDAKEVSSGYECGIGIENYNDIKEGDTLESFKMEEVVKNNEL